MMEQEARTIHTSPGKNTARSLCAVNLHALVCLEKDEPPDPAALTSHWGFLGTLAGPWKQLGGGTWALEYSTEHYDAGTF